MTFGLRVALFVAAMLFVAQPVRAEDLRDVASRAKEAWARGGGEVVSVSPRFVFDDETVSVALPSPTRLKAAPCVSVALVAPRGLGIHAHFSGAEDTQAASAAGILELASCSGTRPDRVVVTAVSGRGAIEIVTAFSQTPLAPTRTIYPERTGGVIPSVPEPGGLAPLPPANRRADLAEARARADAAAIASRETFASGDDGSGSFQVELEPGCYKFEIFGTEPRSIGVKGRLDVDAELRNADEDTVLARDRSEATDAHLDACVGGDTLGEIYFAGTPPHSEVVMTRAVWAIPEHLPRAWGHEPRARMAAALRVRHAPPLTSDPVFVAQGPAGLTPVPIEIEPGACYVAVAAISHGTPRGVGLRAAVGGEFSSDDRGLNDDSGALAFCAGGNHTAHVVVDARGTSLAWVLALFRVSHGAWGAK